ncbi:hypothetical protein [Luteitalea sp. TBR-22]|uniref:hypothetical protein n=1 Tax=Luteitalea sp. TBR-22 TaxID=2802971 RepID=UPI001EF56DA3|nr:hypothetical protein [Luteitalea sp. TBR-22]
MLVYRSAGRDVDPGLEISRCLTMAADDVDEATTRLLGLGSLEASLVDGWCRTRDGMDPRATTFSVASRWAARVLLALDAGDEPAAAAAERHFRSATSACLRLTLPAHAHLRVPEGFAYYAVHPLAYAAAVARCLARERPPRVVVVGLRTIGATLAAVAAARCEAEGVPVWSTTLRPRGHPFAREYEVEQAWSAQVEAQRGALCLIVDEGPGLSGSSLVSAAALLERHGHLPSRIVFVCSHDPDPSVLKAADARERWRRYGREVALIRSPDFAQDWSAGHWREHIGLPPSAWPAVHPQHERHKGVPGTHPDQLHKFVGLGPYGLAVRRRAERAAEAGFGVPILGHHDGYLQMRRVSPTLPLDRRGSEALAGALTTYLPWRASAMQTGARADVDAALALLEGNTREHFGSRLDAGLLPLEGLAHRAGAQPAVVLDGHLAPWEWLQTPQGVVKVDTAEHGDDHFQPGPHDIAWDVAAALEEFTWTTPERTSLVERLTRAMRDPGLATRLRYMQPCYLAARLGYSTLAAETLGDTPDGLRFGRLRNRYAHRLSEALTITS